jgi:hypothetical protein
VRASLHALSTAATLALAACGAATPSASEPSALEPATPVTIAIPASTAGLVAPPTLPAPTAPRAPVTGGEPPPGEMTYEAALASTLGDEGPGTPLTDAELLAPMRDATFVSACGAPASMKVTVRVAVRDGRASGVSIYPSPADPEIARCIARAVRKLVWTSTAHRDLFTTTY